MDTVLVLHFDASCQVHFISSDTAFEQLAKDERLILETALLETAACLKKDCPALYKILTQKTIQLRLYPFEQGTARLMPHEIAMNIHLLRPEKRRVSQRQRLLVGVLERVFYHLCHPELHITEVRLHSLRFLQSHKDILAGTLSEMKASSPAFDEPDWYETLRQADHLVLLDEFWQWLAQTGAVVALFLAAMGAKARLRPKIKGVMAEEIGKLSPSFSVKTGRVERMLMDIKSLYRQENSLVIVYHFAGNLYKAVRICTPDTLDAMSAHSACRSIRYRNLRVDLFHDHGRWIRRWIERLNFYAKEPDFEALESMLLSDDLRQVKEAIKQLRQKIRRKEHVKESRRLLYSALYYWNISDKSVCRSVNLEVSRLLEDVLTDRPPTFPPSRVNRIVLRSEPRTITVDIPKPHTVRSDRIQARILWSLNGYRKKPVLMEQSHSRPAGGVVRFTATLPIRNGWSHYAVQFSLNNGKTWQWEEFHENSSGLIKSMADERGQRVLSFYADTLNLKLDSNYMPVRDERGLFVYGTFDDIAAQLEDFRKEGYTRIYPLGALELGWAGEAGPDPSVFSVLDGRTVRRDLGGLEALLRLREKADALGMKILLCMLSHFSRANSEYDYHFPVYILNDKGVLTRRAGWDGEWSEWLDSFMVNMRDFDNVEKLAEIGIELTKLGFGLRVDVGHGFDTVFPVDPRQHRSARLFGEVTVGGYEPIDLRKTEEPNISLLYICYKIQKTVPNALLVYSEQWHGNEVRMLKAGTIPYNSLIKNMETIRSGQTPDAPLGLNDNIKYLARIYNTCGGQTLSLFNSHDEESPASNYQNMIWPVAAYLTLSAYGPLMYHISRLPGPEAGTMTERFDIAYTECWKHWVNNRFRHPWHEEARTRNQILENYPILRGFGKYLRGLYQFVNDNPAFVRGTIEPVYTGNGRIAAFLRTTKRQIFLGVFNFPNPYHEGQQAVARYYNFLLNESIFNPEHIYEAIERYNNAEGRTRRGRREFWSGLELMRLGFGGILEPVSSHVFEFLDKTDEKCASKQLLLDSFSRYQRYGRHDRIRYSYVAQVFSKTLEQGGQKGFEQFSDLFVELATWIFKKNQIGHTALAELLAEISEHQLRLRQTVIDYLMRIAVNIKKRYESFLCRSAADILQGMNLGTIALVSPESQFSGNAGGVGIYTTDIADVLSELGFHVVVVTPLYESSRERILKTFAPRYDGHSFAIQFPEFNDTTQSIQQNTVPDIVNILRSNLLRIKHGKRSRVEVLYLENAKYLDVPYGGLTCEDKFRRARILSQGALEALRAYNYYPSIIQTNEWPTWLLPAYLKRWAIYHEDPHFSHTHVGSMMHNPHPSYSIVMDEANPFKRYYYSLVIGLDAVGHSDICLDSNGSTPRIDMTSIMLKTSDYIGTVSQAMKSRILAEPSVFQHADHFARLEAQGRFFGLRNGFNMAARQRFWFRSKKSILEVYDKAARKRLFAKYSRAKKLAKPALQNDPNIRLKPDETGRNHVIFSMLHRICKQKGFELLVDWKVYVSQGRRCVIYEPWKMMGQTVLEFFLSCDPRIQYVICGRVEDSFDGRRFDMHFRRIAAQPEFQGRFAYYPEGSLSPSLYRNVYVGSQYFVMPSGGEVGEPCGISQQEAHAGGTPVVAHHQDGLISTVSDRDFGDKDMPSNGIKFSGFNGEALLDALLDAVEIFFRGHRLRYVDKNGRPRRLRYSELSYNAFTTDHRWIRLLRDYIRVYHLIAGQELPEHIDAVRLAVDLSRAPDHELADIILQNGLTIPEATDCLVNALACKVPDVVRCVKDIIERLYGILGTVADANLQKKLSEARAGDEVRLAKQAGIVQDKLVQQDIQSQVK